MGQFSNWPGLASFFLPVIGAGGMGDAVMDCQKRPQRRGRLRS
jgi:hypothetical protein